MEKTKIKLGMILGLLMSLMPLSQGHGAEELTWQSAIVFSCGADSETVSSLPTGACTTAGVKKCKRGEKTTDYPTQAECKPKPAPKSYTKLWSRVYSLLNRECDRTVETLPQSGTSCETKSEVLCLKGEDDNRVCSEVLAKTPRCYFADGNDELYWEEDGRNSLSIQWNATNASDGWLTCSLNSRKIVDKDGVGAIDSYTFDSIDGPGKINCRLVLGQGTGTYSAHSCTKTLNIRKKTSCKFEPIEDISVGEGALIKWSTEGSNESSLHCKQNGKHVYQTPLGEKNTFKGTDQTEIKKIRKNGRVTCYLGIKDSNYHSVDPTKSWRSKACEVSFNVGTQHGGSTTADNQNNESQGGNGSSEEPNLGNSDEPIPPTCSIDEGAVFGTMEEPYRSIRNDLPSPMVIIIEGVEFAIPGNSKRIWGKCGSENDISGIVSLEDEVFAYANIGSDHENAPSTGQDNSDRDSDGGNSGSTGGNDSPRASDDGSISSTGHNNARDDADRDSDDNGQPLVSDCPSPESGVEMLGSFSLVPGERSDFENDFYTGPKGKVYVIPYFTGPKGEEITVDMGESGVGATYPKTVLITDCPGVYDFENSYCTKQIVTEGAFSTVIGEESDYTDPKYKGYFECFLPPNRQLYISIFERFDRSKSLEYGGIENSTCNPPSHGICGNRFTITSGGNMLGQ